MLEGTQALVQFGIIIRRAPSWTMELAERSSGSTSPRFFRQRRPASRHGFVTSATQSLVDSLTWPCPCPKHLLPRLRQARLGKRLTQAAGAEALDVSQSVVAC